MFDGTRSNDSVDFSIYYKKNGRRYDVHSESSFLKIDNSRRKGYLELKLKMKSLTWGVYNELQVALISGDYKQYKENKLKSLIVEWDAKNIKGELVPITINVIENLCPDIAEEILKSYDSIMLISDEEERKVAGEIHGRIMGTGKSVSAASRAIIENDLIEEFHWLPQDIAKIPYKQLQMFFLVRREKHAARNAKIAIDALKRQQEGSSQRGQKRRFIK